MLYAQRIDPVDLSIVVPVFNEADNVALLISRVVAAVEPSTLSYQLLLVDDGSKDETAERIKEAALTNGRVELLSLARNFGHQMALTAGLDHARGRVVISMDGDLQHPPELIPELLALYQQGNDVVYTVREQEEGLSWFKRTSSSAFYRLFNSLSPVKILEASSDFRLMSRKAVEAVKAMPERHRFLRGMIPWTGMRHAVLKYKPAQRHAGVAKYSPLRMISMALDASFSFSRLPLQVATLLGLATVIGCMTYLVAAVVAWYYGRTVEGWTGIMATVLFLGGVQLLCVGLLGEYVGRIYEEVKGRPLYVVHEHVRARALSGQESNPRVEQESIH